MIYLYSILILIVGVLVGLSMNGYSYNSGYAHGKDDAEQLYSDIMGKDVERKTSINGKYRVREEEVWE